MLLKQMVSMIVLALSVNGIFAEAGQGNYQQASPIQVSPPVMPKPMVIKANKNQLLHSNNTGKLLSGAAAVNQANKKSIVKATSADTVDSIIVFPYQPGDLYEIYTTPLNVTDVQLQAGEEIISVAAGDTMRWQISKTVSGTDSNRVEHLFIKPVTENLNTTMVITTNWRTYHLLLRSTQNTFMAAVEWQYNDQGTMYSNLADNNSLDQSNANIPLNLAKLDFSYKMKLARGNKPDWLPLTIFNDGSKTYIEFSQTIQSAPTLFIKESDSGDAAVNYRVVGNYYVVDQVFTDAELVSGDGSTVVEIYYGK